MSPQTATEFLPPPAWLEVSAKLVRHLPMGRYRVMNWLCRRPHRPFLARVGNVKFECDLRNSLAREVYFTGLYEPQETLLLDSLLSSGDTFVDVGAHWGYFSFLAAQKVGSRGKVFSIEADPRIFETLARNVGLNGLSWVEVSHFAAGAGEGEVLLSGYSETQDNWGTSRVVSAERGDRMFRVASQALDSFLDKAGVSQVALVKMDIEGAEVFALEGMRRGMKAQRYQRILLELHPVQIRELGHSPEQILEQMSAAGYHAYVIKHSPEFTRKMAYGHPIGTAELLKPLSNGDELDAWPHFLFVAEGQPALPGVKL